MDTGEATIAEEEDDDKEATVTTLLEEAVIFKETRIFQCFTHLLIFYNNNKVEN
jgi:hypothetical protein